MILTVSILCPVVSAADFTMQVNGVDSRSLNNPTFTWGDTIRFAGTLIITDADRANPNANQANLANPSVYIYALDPSGKYPLSVPSACKGLSTMTGNPIKVASDHTWSYNWNTGESLCGYPNADVTLTISDDKTLSIPGATMIPFTMKAVVTPTPTPTPDYNAKIAALETKLAAQDTKIAEQAAAVATQGKVVAEIAAKTPTPTPVPTVRTTRVTPKPTVTIDHAAAEKALEQRLAEVEAAQQKQGDFISQIMKWLGIG